MKKGWSCLIKHERDLVLNMKHTAWMATDSQSALPRSNMVDTLQGIPSPAKMGTIVRRVVVFGLAIFFGYRVIM